MKKRITKVLMAGMIAAALGFTALAADLSGLRAFLDTRTYGEGQFLDVAAGTWYECGVKTVFEKGIMGGVSERSFAPQETVTWAEAVTIAARLHGVYNNAEIPGVDGAWYAKYIAYAENEGFLPERAPKDAAVETEVISRQDLAGLLREVFAERDLPVVNDGSVPDLESVLPELRDAVQVLCAAGIFTGKDDGRFDPDSGATRAEVAVVISRLLDPGLRVSADSAADENMREQWGNYENGGFAAELGDVTFYTARTRTADGWNYCIVVRDDNGGTAVVYETDLALTRLLVSEDGVLYFVEDKNSLMRLDPAVGMAERIYRSPGVVEHFTLYDGAVYVFDGFDRNGRSEEWEYRIGRVEKNSLVILLNNMPFDAVRYLDFLHGYNGKLYYVYGNGNNDTIWSLDLETGKTAREHTESIYLGEAAFDGAVYWYLRVNGDGEWEIVRGNLAMKEYETVLAVLPEAAQKRYSNLYANGSRLFFQSSEAACLWEIGASGEVYDPVALPGVNYENSCVTKQGILFLPLQTLSALTPHQIEVLLPNGGRQTYPEFLNMPFFVWMTELCEPTGGEVLWESDPAAETDVSAEVVRAYITENGDVVVEMIVKNDLPSDVRMVDVVVTLSDQQGASSTVYYVSRVLDAGAENVLSAVIPRQWKEQDPDLTSLSVDITLKYNEIL